MAHLIPGGKTKGTAIEQAEEKDLLYWLGRLSRDLGENPDKNYADRDRAWIAATRAELGKRGLNPDDLPGLPAAQNGQRNGAAAPTNGHARPPQQQSTALAKAPAGPSQLVTSARDVNAVNAQLEELSAKAHLVTPATSCASLPEGCEIAISFIHVSANTEKTGPGDVAPVGGGKLSLSGTVLKKIGAAAGVSWDMTQSGRLDDGSDPHYCHYRAVGQVRQFDGAMRTVSGEVEIDMRDGSPQIVAMYARAKEGANLDSQIRDTRLFLIRHAETKAKLRAIADLGIRRSYTAAELSKPFAVARLMFTGRSDNPELARMFAEKMADAHMASVRGLYGQAQQPALPQARQMMALPVREEPQPAPPEFRGHAPPTVGQGTVEPDDYGEQYPDDEALEKPTAPAKPASNPGAQPAAEQTGKL